MSLPDFLYGCTPVLNGETEEFRDLCRELSGIPTAIHLLPALLTDLWPIHVLEDTDVHEIVNPENRISVYLTPLGAHDFEGLDGFQRYIRAIYRNEPGPDMSHIYGCAAEQIIMLSYPGLRYNFPAYGEKCNVVYVRLRTATDRVVHIFGICDTADGCWKEIIEPCCIPSVTLTDSSRGLGQWLATAPLYGLMRACTEPELLPRFFFKGKDIPTEPGRDYELIREIPLDGKIAGKLYRTPWY